MELANDNFVPKIDPRTRSAEVEDPFELVAEPVGGDPAVMLECILQEFLWMGWSARDLLSLFHHPGYPVLNQLREHFGEKAIASHVASLVGRWGELRFRETIVEPDVDELHGAESIEHELVQLTLPLRRDG